MFIFSHFPIVLYTKLWLLYKRMLHEHCPLCVFHVTFFLSVTHNIKLLVIPGVTVTYHRMAINDVNAKTCEE